MNARLKIALLLAGFFGFMGDVQAGSEVLQDKFCKTWGDCQQHMGVCYAKSRTSAWADPYDGITCENRKCVCKT